MSDRGLIEVSSEKQIVGVVVPALADAPMPDETRLEETCGLVEALGVGLGFSRPVRVRRPSAGILFGEGQIAQLAEQLLEVQASMIVVDCTLTPVQQRNLEKRLSVKVIDRTGLILEIFGLRARTAEGRLQVEMARLLYERSRLVRTWTHLERQRGGRGFLAGPGESQLEADRRMLDNQLSRLKADLQDVRRTRGIQRAGRQKRGKPVVALVGYTNAGKSTLFNRLAQSEVFAANMPFATLDPTIRDIELPSGETISLVDTVGFITDLPTTLVESFRATVEEAIEADLLLHVRDIAHTNTEQQADDVLSVLQILEKETGKERPPMLEVWNKADLLDVETREAMDVRARQNGAAVLLSAIDGDAVDQLLQMVAQAVFEEKITITAHLPFEAGKARAWLHDHGEVVREEADIDTLDLEVILALSDIRKFASWHPEVKLTGWEPENEDDF